MARVYGCPTSLLAVVFDVLVLVPIGVIAGQYTSAIVVLM